MQQIIPCLCFNNEAEAAINLYTSLFDNSGVQTITPYNKAMQEELSRQRAGVKKRSTDNALSINFQLCGQEFIAINTGLNAQFTPATSFFIECRSEEEIRRLFNQLSENGKLLMPLANYGFSLKFTWIEDRYGVSWQLNLSDTNEEQTLSIFLMFAGKLYGRAEEAINLYVSLIQDSAIINIDYMDRAENGLKPTINHATFRLGGRQMMAIDSNMGHLFTISDAICLYVLCDSQEQIEKLSSALSAGGERQEHGWVKDKFGVSWKIVYHA